MTRQIVSAWECENRRVTVEKALERPERPPVLVTFTITSNADEPVALRIVDDLPASIPTAAVGFHPTYKRDNWCALADGVQFVEAIAPGETRFAFYYLESDRADGLARFGPPAIEDVTRIGPNEVATYDPSEWCRSRRAGISERVVTDGPLPNYLTVVTDDDAPHGPEGGSGLPSEAAGRDEPELVAESDGTESPSTPDVDDDREVTPEQRGDREAMPDQRDDSTRADAGTDDANAVFDELRREYDVAEYEEFGDEVERYYAADVSFDELLGGADPDATTDVGSTRASRRSENSTDEGSGSSTEATDSPAKSEFRWGDAGSGESADGSLLTGLRRELEREGASAESVVALREALGVVPAVHESVRIRHLQSQVADLSAYFDALEAFLDEGGTAERVLTVFENDLDSMQTRLGRLASDVAETADREARLRERIDDLERALESASAVEATTERLSADASRRDDRFDDLEATVEAITADQERIHDLFRTIAEEVTSANRADGRGRGADPDPKDVSGTEA